MGFHAGQLPQGDRRACSQAGFSAGLGIHSRESELGSRSGKKDWRRTICRHETQVPRVRSEPAKDEMAAGRRRAWFRGLLLRDRSRRVRGSRPDSQPAPRMVQPLIPELSAFVAGDELSSIETPINRSQSEIHRCLQRGALSSDDSTPHLPRLMKCQ